MFFINIFKDSLCFYLFICFAIQHYNKNHLLPPCAMHEQGFHCHLRLSATASAWNSISRERPYSSVNKNYTWIGRISWYFYDLNRYHTNMPIAHEDFPIAVKKIAVIFNFHTAYLNCLFHYIQSAEFPYFAVRMTNSCAITALNSLRVNVFTIHPSADFSLQGKTYSRKLSL